MKHVSPKGGPSGHGDQQKKKIVEAAFALIAEHGFEGLRTRDIAARAEINISTFHYYFQTKEDLIRGVADKLTTDFQRQSEALPPGSPRVEHVRHELTDMLTLSRQNPTQYIVLFELCLRAFRNPELRPIIDRMMSGWQDFLNSLMRSTGPNASAAENAVLAQALRTFSMGLGWSFLLARDSFPGPDLVDTVSGFFDKT